MRVDADPVTGDDYEELPWRDIGLSVLARLNIRETVAITHFEIVDRARAGTTIAERLRLMGDAIALGYAGLEEADGRALGEEWVTLLADLASCGPQGIEAWAAAYGESTGNYWPPKSTLLARGIVNAIVHSHEVERLHVSDRANLFDEQVGTMCANWAGGSLVGELLDGPDPDGWGLTDDDFARAARDPLFSAVPERFPAGWTLIEALGRCVRERTNACPVVLPEAGSAEEAYDWLTSHSGEARFRDAVSTDMPPNAAPSAQVTVRHAWTAPTEDELRNVAEARLMHLPTLTRVSRNPLHLAAALQWAARSGVIVATPNVAVSADEVGYRLRPVPPPSLDTKNDERQSFHRDSWKNSTGLSLNHALVLGITPGGAERPGRNDPCPCGSGAKYKRCHGR